MKSLGIGMDTPGLFRKLGFTVDVSTVECCGMAGSFGYKKQYHAEQERRTRSRISDQRRIPGRPRDRHTRKRDIVQGTNRC